MKIVLNTSPALDAQLDKLSELQGKSWEELGQELTARNLLANVRDEVLAARKAALNRVLVPVPGCGTERRTHTPIDWSAVDNPTLPLYQKIKWPAPPARSCREEMNV